MPKYTTNAQERIARQRYHDAMFLGVDGDGKAHFWSRYDQAVIVLDDERVETDLTLAETPLTTLAEWMDHTRTKRGAWRHHRVDSSLGETFAAATEVA